MVESLQPIELTEEWIEGIRRIAPEKPTVPPQKRRRVILYSVSHGYKHWVIPHTDAVVKVLAEKSGGFEVVASGDPEIFVPERLAGFDAVIFNNTCPIHPRRDSFMDVLEDEARSEELKDNLLEFIRSGGGHVAIHGGILAFNNCPKWDEMQGGSFDYHPAQQQVVLSAVDPEHPLARAFGNDRFVHMDEPYLFANAYRKKNFRPLLVMDTTDMVMPGDKPEVTDACYAAWIKRYGAGRFFYCSPSHNAQSFEDSRLLRFLLDGIQYALGDLACDDTPVRPGEE